MGIDFDADKTEQANDWGQTITYGGSNYPAIVSLPDSARDFDEDGSGYILTRTLVVEVSKAKLGTGLAIGEKITFEGDVYRIEDLGPYDETGWYYLTCTGVTE